MALKKSELYSSLWASCDELRGGMDASQYKVDGLVLLFIKYVSDKYAGVPYAPITIPKGASFKDMVELKGKPDIGDQINKKIIAPLEKANKLSDMPDFNDDNKLGSDKDKVDRLTRLIAIFENPALDFSKNRAEGDDILGDAYEYLMRHFATESGKSKGQFYTPAEVSRVMAKVGGIRDAATTTSTTVYDPTCGSGSLLLKVGDEARTKVTLYGQEEGRRHRRPRPHEHDPAQRPHRRHRAGQHPRESQIQGRRHPQNLRQVVANPPGSALNLGCSAPARGAPTAGASKWESDDPWRLPKRTEPDHNRLWIDLQPRAQQTTKSRHGLQYQRLFAELSEASLWVSS